MGGRRPRARRSQCDVVCTVTPGAEPVVGARALRPGQHLNLLGADGAGKAEATVEAVERVLRARAPLLRRVGAGLATAGS